MKINSKRLFGAFAAYLLLAPGTVFAVDPCSVTPNVGSGQKIEFNGRNQQTGNTQSGYSYELWRNGGGSGSITLYNQEAAFKAEWNNAGDYLGRVGKSWGNKPSVDNLGGNLVVNYQFTKSGDDGGSYSYVGIYGWMDNPQIEYYIVDDWLHDRGTPGGSYIGRKVGTIKVDGEDYAVWTGTRTGESKWGNSTFTQIFSIRQSRRQCGTIHISEHFRQWKKLGLQLGGLMEAQILAEAGGGKGYVDFKYATMEINSDSGDGNDAGSNSGNNGGNTNNGGNNNNGGDINNGGTNNGGSSSSEPVDPCSKKDKYTGGTKVTKNGIQNIGNGYNYELWRENEGQGSMTFFGGDADCAFKAEWGNSGDYLARVGYYDGSAKKSYKDLGDITADYNYTKSGNAGGYSYIGVYGWTKEPLIEYYIVDDSYNGMGTPYGSQQVGSYTVDGATYKLYKGMRYNAANITGTNCDFPQVFAVRSSARTCGHISVSEHFKNWESNGINLGGVYDCKIVCEAGGGQGSIEYTYATMTWKGQSGHGGSSTPAEPTEPEEPYKGAIAIPGKLECENYDKGGNGFGYYDTDDENDGSQYREDGVDIVKVSGGYAVGYTAASEWLKYTINVEEDGEYNFGAYMANGSTDPEVSIEIDGKKAVSFTGTGKGDWDTYTLTKGKITLSKGEHTLKIKFDNDYTNIDYIEFSKGDIGGDEPCTDCGGDDPQPITGGTTFFDENGAYFGPSCDNGNVQKSGAYYTGVYPSPFKTYLGKTDEEIQEKLDQLWNHYFKGNDNSKVYYENGNEAYIKDINNNDVRSEGQSYGMMICVQTNHKTEFDKLWKFAKNHMLHTSGQWDGYFKWKCNPDGSAQDANCAPDGEMYFVTALLLAANRWNEPSYFKDAQYSLSRFWKNGNGSLFNESYKIITFQPYNCSNFGDPSYDLPAFVELFSRWSESNNDKWESCLAPTRGHLEKSCHSSSGLFADYSEFNGQPTTGGFSSNSNKYMYDAMRCAMNVGMDYYLFGADKKTQNAMMTRLINHFEKDGYSHARFNWDGTGGSESYTLGECGANAVGCFALMDDPANDEKVKTNLKKAWNGQLMTGQYRYYDGLVHYLAMLHLCGSFKIYKPAPEIKNKEVKGVKSVEYLGVTYKTDTTIVAFDECQLYNVSIMVDPGSVDDVNANGVVIAPNPASDAINVIAEDLESVKIVDMLGRTVAVSTEATVNVSNLPAGTYAVVVKTSVAEVVKKINVLK